MSDMEMLLEVKDLKVTFSTPRGTVHAVSGGSFSVRRGEVTGIVGESGDACHIFNMYNSDSDQHCD